MRATRLFPLLCMILLISCGDSPTETAEPPAVVLSTAVADFSGTKGDPMPRTATVDVQNGGGGSLAGLSASVAYGAGQPGGWLSAVIDRSTAPAVLTLSARADVTEAGSFDATVRVSGNGVSDKTIAVTLTLALGEPPPIVVTSPPRAAMLETGTYAATDVRITGQACDPSVPITALEVNGQAIVVSGTRLCEPFDVVQSSPWGMSVITASATNAFGRKADLVQSYLRSPSYAPSSFPPPDVDDGFVAEVFAPLLDDSDSSSIDDLATFTELGLGTLNLRSLVPTTVYSSPVLGCDLLTVTTRGISMGGYHVTAAIESAGVGVGITGSDLVWGLRFTYTGCLGNVTTVDGLFLADAVNSSYLLDFAIAGGDPTPTLTIRSTGIVAPRFQFDAGAFIQAVLDTIQSVVKGELEFRLTAEEHAFMEERAADVRATWERVHKSQQQRARELRSKRRPPHNRHIVERRAAGRPPHYFSPSSGRNASIQAHNQAATVPAAPPLGTHPSAGSLRADAPPADLLLPSGGNTAYGVRLDLLNQLLWVAWQTGDFDDPDLEGLLGHSVPGLDMKIFAMLPPVLRPGAGGATLGVDWGDVAITATVDPAVFGLPGAPSGGPVTIEAYASARIDFGLAYDGANDTIVVTSPSADVRVQVVGIDAPLDESAIGEAIKTAAREWVSMLAEDFADAIPTTGEIDFSSLPGLPPGLVFGFKDVVVGAQDGYVTLSGNIR